MRMERLTARNKNGEAYYPECYRKDGCDGFGGNCDICKFSYGVCETLAAYEDTCLTPDQLRQIRIWYEELATELARYKAAIAEAAKKPQEDEIFYLFHLDCYNKGWKDAVEFIEGAIKEVTE